MPRHTLIVVIGTLLAAAARAQGPDAESRTDLESRIAAARVAVDDADRTTGNESLRAARARRFLAQYLSEAGRFAAAIEADRQVLGILRKNPSAKPSNLASVLGELVVFLYRVNRITEALPLAREAVRTAGIAYGAKDRRLAMFRYVLAGVEIEVGNFEQAERELRSAVAILRDPEAASSRELLNAVQGLGCLLTTTGNYSEARVLLSEAGRVSERNPSLGADLAASGEGLLGRLEDDLGRFREARAHFEKQAAMLQDASDAHPEDVAVVLANLAHVLWQDGDLDQARRMFEKARKVCEETVGRRRLGYILNEHANLEMMRGDPMKGEALAAEAVATEQSRSDPDRASLARALQALAIARLVNRRAAEALPPIEEALALERRLFGPTGRGTARDGEIRGRTLVALGRHDEARAAFHEALLTGRAWLASATEALSETERLGAIAQIRSLMDVWMSVTLPDPANAAAVADEVLAWQGQVLRALHAERSWLRAHADPEITELRSRLARIADELAPEHILNPAHQTLSLAHGGPTELLAERERIERDLSARVAKVLTRSAGADLVSKALDADEALVDYFAFRACDAGRAPGTGRREEHVSAIVLRPGRPPVALDLGPLTTIRDAVGAHITVVSRLDRPDRAAEPIAAAAAAAARQRVWEPVAGLVAGASRVFIVPDAFLAALPFETLPGGAPGRYLIEEKEIVYLPVAEARISASQAPLGRGALLVGGVAFGKALAPVNEDARGLREALGIPLSPLPRSEDEVAGVAKALGAGGQEAAITSLMGEAATEAAVREGVLGKRFVHFATHGIFAAEATDGRSPSDSRVDFKTPTTIEGFLPFTRVAVALAGVNDFRGRGKDDGLLTAGEAAWLDLSACELVVLSGCESGLGAARAGESVLGLRRAFHLAGSRSTVTALWRIGDEGAADLMIAFYEKMLAGRGKSAALREARLAMLERNRARHGGLGLPATWGAFVIDGDWK